MCAWPWIDLSARDFAGRRRQFRHGVMGRVSQGRRAATNQTSRVSIWDGAFDDVTSWWWWRIWLTRPIIWLACDNDNESISWLNCRRLVIRQFDRTQRVCRWQEQQLWVFQQNTTISSIIQFECLTTRALANYACGLDWFVVIAVSWCFPACLTSKPFLCSSRVCDVLYVVIAGDIGGCRSWRYRNRDRSRVHENRCKSTH